MIFLVESSQHSSISTPLMHLRYLCNAAEPTPDGTSDIKLQAVPPCFEFSLVN